MDFKKYLEENGEFQIFEINNGSSVFKLIPSKSIDHEQLKYSSENQQIFLPNWNKKDQCFYIKMNDSLVYNDMQKTADALLKY